MVISGIISAIIVGLIIGALGGSWCRAGSTSRSG